MPCLSPASEPDTIVFEKPCQPGRADLEALTGAYVSDEAEAACTVALDGGRLVIRQRPATRIVLTPTYRDAFSSSTGSVRFLRDPSRKVTELSLGESRVWDIRFRRVK